MLECMDFIAIHNGIHIHIPLIMYSYQSKNMFYSIFCEHLILMPRLVYVPLMNEQIFIQASEGGSLLPLLY